MNIPNPLTIDGQINELIAELKSQGFSGENIFLAGHSLGGVISQNYLLKHTNIFKG
jgi:predicted esterase